jgi:hypothetical protein
MCGERAGREPPQAAQRDNKEVWASLEEGASSPLANECLQLTPMIQTLSSIRTLQSVRLSRQKGALSSLEVDIEGSKEDGGGDWEYRRSSGGLLQSRLSYGTRTRLTNFWSRLSCTKGTLEALLLIDFAANTLVQV